MLLLKKVFPVRPDSERAYVIDSELETDDSGEDEDDDGFGAKSRK